jgi:hypothetical protein
MEKVTRKTFNQIVRLLGDLQDVYLESDDCCLAALSARTTEAQLLYQHEMYLSLLAEVEIAIVLRKLLKTLPEKGENELYEIDLEGKWTNEQANELLKQAVLYDAIIRNDLEEVKEQLQRRIGLICVRREIYDLLKKGETDA